MKCPETITEILFGTDTTKTYACPLKVKDGHTKCNYHEWTDTLTEETLR